MILFDCERLRKPFSGKDTYCRNLATALEKESRTRAEKLGLYMPACAEPFLEALPHRPWHRYHKWFFRAGSDVRLFHRTTPLTYYFPKNVPLVTTVHDLNFLHYEPNPRKREREDRCTRIALDVSERIVTISNDARRDILKYYGDPGKPIDVIYNGVTRYSGPVTRPADAPDGDFILSICRLTRSKNLQTLPPLLAGNDFKLVIIGKNIEDGQVEEILAAADKWNVRDRVIFTGGIPEDEKHWYLRNCKAFLFPSLAEGFGLPVIEAMQYGIPTFISDRTSLPEIGGDCAFYFNHEFDPDGMRQEFEKGMSDFRSGVITPEAMKRRATLFNWETAAKKYYDIYESLL